MLSRSSEYALRALIFLVEKTEEWPVARNEIARVTGIPGKYLSKILSDLVKIGILSSSRGMGGGFSLTRPPDEIILYDIVTLYETLEQVNCPFGNKKCSDENPCLAHDLWKKVIEAQLSFLQQTTVLDVAVPKKTKIGSK